MESSDATITLAALAQEGRLALFRLLVRRLPGRVAPSELAAALGSSPSLVSAQLAVLARAGLVSRIRAGKSLLYRVEMKRLDALVRHLVEDCCNGRPELALTLSGACRSSDPGTDGDAMGPVPFDILFVCTRNAARSQLAESLVRHRHATRFRPFSAGTLPADEPDPSVLALLRDVGHDITQLRAKRMDEFLGADAPRMDFVFTLCDRAANEACANWPGGPVTAHWGIPDPLAAGGGAAEVALALRTTLGALERRFAAFAALPFESLDRLSLQREVDAIASLDLTDVADAGSG